MPARIDLEFFKEISDDNSFRRILEIATWQKVMLEQNRMPEDQSEIILNLNGQAISIEAGSAVNALEIYQEIFRDEEHSNVQNFVPTKKTEIILDFGANYGFYAMWAKKKSPNAHILCVEPNPFVFKHLKKNLAHLPNIELCQKALASKNGQAEFDFIRQIPSIGGKTIKMIHRDWLDEKMVDSCTVKTISINSILKRYADQSVDILKMDIEGAEGEVIAGTSHALLESVNKIVLERHSKELRHQVFNSLVLAGFHLVHETDPGQNSYYGNMYFQR